MQYFMKKITKKSNQTGGFTVLYAMLIAALLLSIGISIYNVLLKDLSLSESASDSQIALFSAESGLECALYWDFKGTNVFATSTASGAFAGTANCGPNSTNIVQSGFPTNYSLPATPWYLQEGANYATTTFTVYYVSGSSQVQTTGNCAIVSIGKYVNGASVNTSVSSLGYNTCDNTSSRRVERGLEVSY
jgi:Tfp pilus assembly protein PilX